MGEYEDFKNAFSRFTEFNKENSKYLIEMLNLMAKNNRTYFELLISQGFTEEQALELLKYQGFKVPR